jgi:hypothetical protein
LHSFSHHCLGSFDPVQLHPLVETVHGCRPEFSNLFFHFFVILLEFINSAMQVSDFSFSFFLGLFHLFVEQVFGQVALCLLGGEFRVLSLKEVAVLVLDVGEFGLDLLDLLAEVFADVEGEVFVVEFGQEFRQLM